MNNFIHSISIKRSFALLGLFLILASTAFTQEGKTEEIKGADAVREEIQRYMGYEPLMPRYLTLPYDATTNSNVYGPYMDIGYLFMALIPILFLFGFRNKPWIGIACMILLSILLYISIGNGKLFYNNGFIKTHTFTVQNPNASFDNFPDNIIIPIYKTVSNSYGVINKFFNQKSGNADSITYPFLFLMFVLMIYLIRERTIGHKNEKRIFILFIAFFTFMWMLLTAGIIWYGYPMIALSILVILSSISPKKSETEKRSIFRIKQIIGLASISIFIAFSMHYRLSNYAVMMNPEMGKLMIDIGELRYQSGRQNKREVLEGFFPGGFNEAIEKINQEDESLVYGVGTVLPFFVKKNDKRVFKDNQLQNFEKLRVHYQDKNTLIEVLKSGGFKYIFVDLNTFGIDNTPEKTLEKKYIEFMRVLFQNPKVKLLATDRRINISEDPHKPIAPGYGVFAKPLPGFNGKYAIFELL